jgi:hypothetical protein
MPTEKFDTASEQTDPVLTGRAMLSQYSRAAARGGRKRWDA